MPTEPASEVLLVDRRAWAGGNVRTLLYNTSANATAEARKVPMQSTSDVLIARKLDRRVNDLSDKIGRDQAAQLQAASANLVQSLGG